MGARYRIQGLYSRSPWRSAQPSPVLAQRVVDLGHPLAVTDPSWDGSRVFQRKGTDGGGYVGGTFSSD